MPDGIDMGDFFEPGALSTGIDPALASIAISLRRIADGLLRERVGVSGGEPRIAIDPALVASAEIAPPSLDRQLLAGFTPTERRVVALIVQGLQTPEIAHRLGRAEGTMRVHIGNIFQKADVSTRTALVARLYRLGEPA